MHPLKLTSLLAWGGLFGFQLSLLLPGLEISVYWALLLTLPLLIPIYGLVRDRRYTYRWVGFLTLIYFCIGISEWAANPELRIYGLGTTICSTLLFFASIYHARYLGTIAKN